MIKVEYEIRKSSPFMWGMAAGSWATIAVYYVGALLAAILN